MGNLCEVSFSKTTQRSSDLATVMGVRNHPWLPPPPPPPPIKRRPPLDFNTQEGVSVRVANTMQILRWSYSNDPETRRRADLCCVMIGMMSSLACIYLYLSRLMLGTPTMDTADAESSLDDAHHATKPDKTQPLVAPGKDALQNAFKADRHQGNEA